MTYKIMYEILLIPKGKSFKPHIWKEGGEFSTTDKAKFQANQIRKMKDRYAKAIVVSANKPLAVIEAKDGDGITVIQTYEIYERTFEAKQMPAKSPERKFMNDNTVTSEHFPEYKFAMKLKDGMGLAYRTKEEAVHAAKNLSGNK